MQKSFLTLFVLLTISTIPAKATVWNIGPSHTYTAPNALYLADQIGDIDIANYDTIYIDPGDYSGTDALAAWQQDNLYITGTGGIVDRPHMIADGAYILGKGIWVCVGDNITVADIEFSGASVPDENGAGIRLDGIGLTLIQCYFHNNENGLLTSNPYDGDILIDFCEFAYNGFGDGFTHNMYIGHVNSFTISNSYSHHTNVGHNVKSRADNNYILYNRIMDESDGNSSRLIDIPNGGYALVKGNVLMQGPSALNNNAVGYGLEGLSNPAPHDFYFVHNTVVNKREASCRFLNIEDGTGEAYIVNNIFAGTGELVDGITTTFSHNYSNTDIAIFDFMAEATYDYRLLASSPVIDSGLTLTGDLIPEYQYLGLSRTMHGDRNDVGAYEYTEPSGIAEHETVPFTIYPNPSRGTFYIDSKLTISEIVVFNSIGETILVSAGNSKAFELDQSPGVYLVRVTNEEGIVWQQLVLE